MSPDVSPVLEAIFNGERKLGVIQNAVDIKRNLEWIQNIFRDPNEGISADPRFGEHVTYIPVNSPEEVKLENLCDLVLSAFPTCEDSSSESFLNSEGEYLVGILLHFLQLFDEAMRDENSLIKYIPSETGREYRLTIDILDSSMCQKYHNDGILEVRMLCTLFGQGTWLLDQPGVDLKILQNAPLYDDIEKFNSKVVLDPKCEMQAQPGDLVFLKGTKFPGLEKDFGGVHRSSYASESEPRVLFRLDCLEKESIDLFKSYDDDEDMQSDNISEEEEEME